MEFVIDTNELTKSLYRTQCVIEKKTTMPILSNILLTSFPDGNITIAATDLEIGTHEKLEAEVLSKGSTTISARHLYDIVRSLPNSTVTIKKLENNWVDIQSGKIKYRILGVAAEEFCDLPDVSQINLFPVNSKMIKDMIDKTMHAISTDETRYNLNGSFLEKLDNQVFRMVATDGHRLSIADASITENSTAVQQKNLPLTKGVIIPKKGLITIKRLIETKEGDCALGFNNNDLIFTMNNVTVVVRLLDGQFPDYRRIISDEQEIVFSINRKRFISCLQRINIISSDQTFSSKMVLKNRFLRVEASNSDIGEAQEDIEISYSGSSNITIDFNIRYLLDALSAMSTDEIEVVLNDKLSPGVFRPCEDQTHVCIISPFRT